MSLHFSKCYIVGNHMLRRNNFNVFLIFASFMDLFHLCFYYTALSVPCKACDQLTSKLSCLCVFRVFCYCPKWCPGSGVMLDCIDSQSLRSSILLIIIVLYILIT